MIGQMGEGKLIKGVQRNTADVQRDGRVVCRGMPYRILIGVPLVKIVDSVTENVERAGMCW